VRETVAKLAGSTFGTALVMSGRPPTLATDGSLVHSAVPQQQQVAGSNVADFVTTKGDAGAATEAAAAASAARLRASGLASAAKRPLVQLSDDSSWDDDDDVPPAEPKRHKGMSGEVNCGQWLLRQHESNKVLKWVLLLLIVWNAAVQVSQQQSHEGCQTATAMRHTQVGAACWLARFGVQCLASQQLLSLHAAADWKAWLSCNEVQHPPSCLPALCHCCCRRRKPAQAAAGSGGQSQEEWCSTQEERWGSQEERWGSQSASGVKARQEERRSGSSSADCGRTG
jgi:hypothetical protein